MLENNEKGSFGSYSEAGKNAAMKQYIIVNKNKFLCGNKKKLKNIDLMFNFKSIDNDIPLNSNFKKIKHKINIEKSEKLLCKINKNDTKEEENINNIKESKYKYHIQNHKDIINMIIKKKGIKKYDPSSAKYNPKLEFIWKKILGPPIFNSMTGRNDRQSFGFYFPKSNSASSILNKDHKIKKKYSKGKICKRVIPFIENNNLNQKKIKKLGFERKRNLKQNFTSSNEYFGENDFTESQIKKNIDYNNNNVQSNSLIKKVNEKTTSFSNKSKIYKNTIDFSKTTSREYVNFINRNREDPTEYVFPNYNAINPKCITLIKYHKNTNKSKIIKYKEFDGFDFSYYNDKSKCFNKINNNKEGQKIIFDNMSSRPFAKSSLPSYMIRNDRNSVNCFTNKSLEMNCYRNSKFLTDFSSFKWKSFNKKINMNTNNNSVEKKNVKPYFKKLSKSYSIPNFIKFFRSPFNHLSEDDIGEKVDGITFKIIKKNINIPEEELNRFKIKFKKKYHNE